jgi:hypothetical protein
MLAVLPANHAAAKDVKVGLDRLRSDPFILTSRGSSGQPYSIRSSRPAARPASSPSSANLRRKSGQWSISWRRSSAFPWYPPPYGRCRSAPSAPGAIGAGTSARRDIYRRAQLRGASGGVRRRLRLSRTDPIRQSILTDRRLEKQIPYAQRLLRGLQCPFLADSVAKVSWMGRGACSFCRAQRFESSLPRERCRRINVARFVA